MRNIDSQNSFSNDSFLVINDLIFVNCSSLGCGSFRFLSANSTLAFNKLSTESRWFKYYQNISMCSIFVKTLRVFR